MLLKLPPRVALGQFPTPIEPLTRLSRQLGGPQIYVKRDDQTGLATGGNKTRKLEFILAAAIAGDCDHIVTVGGPQSNHCRQTAAAAVRLGMGCSLVLRGEPPRQRLGNLLLDDLLGAEVHWSGDRSREAVAAEVMAKLRVAGRRPYLVPLGGSTALGAVGYVLGMQEAVEQLLAQRLEIDVMVVASSSAGTQAGLALGASVCGYTGRVLGISIDAPESALASLVRQIAMGSAQMLGLDVLDGSQACATEFGPLRLPIEVNADYLGGGYAVVGDLERNAIRIMAQSEGLLLDPVYTGRAFGALLDLIQKDIIGVGQRVMFWHTGGAAALSAFATEL